MLLPIIVITIVGTLKIIQFNYTKLDYYQLNS